MPFTLSQQQSLLAQKGIGATILKRLQEMGLDNVELLANTSPEFILQRGAEMTGSSCWRNSPQARKAIETAVSWAKQELKLSTEK
ncbi:recombinase RecA [Bisgaard Taxon 45]|uniref:Recombinase RecA n=1 Tax=Bisgaard Taxon 45 TaxID=304289 RepID=A0ABT9KCL1_9PAST|nr:recombinase RecA [Bisgaard Taxon 45]